MTATTITAKQLQDARNAYVSSNANPVALWRSLSGSGDQYATAAYEGLAIDNSPKKEVITAANKINGLTNQQFKDLTQNTASGYLELLTSAQPNPDGTINLPNTTQIETNYYNASLKSGVNPSGAIDLSFERLGINWYSANSPVFVELDPARFGPPSPYVDNISYAAALFQTAVTTVSVTARILQNGVSDEFDAMRTALDNVLSNPHSQSIIDNAAKRGIYIDQSGIAYQNSTGGVTSLDLDNNSISIENNKKDNSIQNFVSTFQFDTYGNLEYKEKDYSDGTSIVSTPNGDGSFSSVTYNNSDQNNGTGSNDGTLDEIFSYTGKPFSFVPSYYSDASLLTGDVVGKMTISDVPQDFSGTMGFVGAGGLGGSQVANCQIALSGSPLVPASGDVEFSNGTITGWHLFTSGTYSESSIDSSTGDTAIINNNMYGTKPIAGGTAAPGTWSLISTTPHLG